MQRGYDNVFLLSGGINGARIQYPGKQLMTTATTTGGGGGGGLTEEEVYQLEETTEDILNGALPDLNNDNRISVNGSKSGASHARGPSRQSRVY